MKIDYTEKVVLITGSIMGIGLGCAEVFAESRARVILNGFHDPQETVVQEALDKIKQIHPEVDYLKGDVTSSSDIREMVKSIDEKYGKLDLLINNAGINLFKGIESTSMKEFDQVIGVDLRGLFEMTKEMLPLLKKAPGASVVHMASVHAHLTIAEITAYCAAKGGVVSMTRSLAQELGPLGIRVNSVSPGFTQTPMLENWLKSSEDPQGTMDRINGLHPLRKIVSPQEIGYAIAFLGSPLASSITGINLVIDGGLSTRVMH